MAVTPVKAEFDFLTAECNKYTGIDGKEVAVHGNNKSYVPFAGTYSYGDSCSIIHHILTYSFVLSSFTLFHVVGIY